MQKIKKKFISKILVMVGTLVSLFIVSIFFTETATTEYTIYNPIVVEAAYMEEVTLEEIPIVHSYEFDTTTMSEIIVCGKDVPIGEYQLIVDRGYTFTAYIQNVGDNAHSGEEVIENQIFTCNEGEQLRYGEGDGTISLVSTTETIEVPISNESYIDSIDTKMTTTFNEDGTVNEVVCSKDNEVIECTTLQTYDKLVEDTIEVQNEDVNKVVVEETMKQRLIITTCQSSEVAHISCEDTVTYNELVNSIE